MNGKFAIGEIYKHNYNLHRLDETALAAHPAAVANPTAATPVRRRPNVPPWRTNSLLALVLFMCEPRNPHINTPQILYPCPLI